MYMYRQNGKRKHTRGTFECFEEYGAGLCARFENERSTLFIPLEDLEPVSLARVIREAIKMEKRGECAFMEGPDNE